MPKGRLQSSLSIFGRRSGLHRIVSSTGESNETEVDGAKQPEVTSEEAALRSGLDEQRLKPVWEVSGHGKYWC